MFIEANQGDGRVPPDHTEVSTATCWQSRFEVASERRCVFELINQGLSEVFMQRIKKEWPNKGSVIRIIEILN